MSKICKCPTCDPSEFLPNRPIFIPNETTFIPIGFPEKYKFPQALTITTKTELIEILELWLKNLKQSISDDIEPPIWPRNDYKP